MDGTTAASPAPGSGRLGGRWSALGPTGGAIIALVVLVAVNAVLTPNFATAGNFWNVLFQLAVTLLVAVGMTLVIATGGIDLSVGSLMAVSGAVSMEFLAAAGDSTSIGVALAAVGLSLLITGILGAVNGVLVAYVGLQPFIATLVLMLAGRGVAKVITGGQNTAASSDPFRWIANGFVIGIPVVFILAVLIVVLVAWVVRRSALGLMIEAIGINPKASRMAGIKPKGLLLTAYVLSGILAGIAGVMSVGSVMTVDISRTGYQLELDAILAVVIGGASLAGGKFSLSGAFVGALLIATLDKTVLYLGVSSSATPAFKAIVIVAICLLQSDRVRSWFQRRKKTVAPAPRVEIVKEEAAA